MSLQGSLGIERMCHLADVSRAEFYRHLRASDNRAEEIQRAVRDSEDQFGAQRTVRLSAHDGRAAKAGHARES